MFMRNPFNSDYRITSDFGYRYLFGQNEFHAGIDIVPTGSDTTLYSPCDGTVIMSAYYQGPRYNGDLTYTWGSFVCIETDNKIRVFLCHMQPNRYVTVGQRVKTGDKIGLMGATGKVTGAHCHFEIRVNNQSVDPKTFLNKKDNEEIKKEEEQEMTGEEIYNALIKYLNEQPESEWSKKEGAFKSLKDMGIMDGTKPKSFVTREQLAAIVTRTVSNFAYEEKE